jgi:glycosyltransferase involved in cell wall biosynthesis
LEGRQLRVLVVSNLYPPHYVGGYELGCRDVVDDLRRRGHDARVVTSTYGVATPRTDGHVYRILRVNLRPPANSVLEAVRLLVNEAINQRRFRRVLEEVRPEVVHVWNLWGTSVSMALIAQRSGRPTGFFVSDNWLAQWERDPWYRLWSGAIPTWAVPGRVILRPVAQALRLVTGGRLELEDVQFTSRFLQEQLRSTGKGVRCGRVVHWGVKPEEYAYRVERRAPRRLLYVGQIVRHKGLHLALEALARLSAASPGLDVTLTVVGGSIRPEYAAAVRQQAQRLGLDERVRFVGPAPRERMPAIYRDHDVLILPSVWDEPFSITLLEAMASGLVAVASATGGTPEILRDGDNGLLFARNDAFGCARAIERLLQDCSLFETLRYNARCTVERAFRFSATVDAVETALHDLTARRW